MPRTSRLIRFKACFTCRARRVKCDEGRPSCQRCQKSGFVCEGYQPSLDFVDETQTFSRNGPMSALANNGHNNAVEDIQLVLQPSPSLNISCFEEEVSLAYFLKNFINIPVISNIDLASVYWPGFLAIQSQQSLSYECLCALARVFFARKNNAQSTMIRGFQAYGSALRRLNILLSGPEVGNSDDALISSMILSVYEFMTASSPVNWIVHCLGFGDIIRLRGPSAYCTAHGQLLLKQNRTLIIFAALAAGQNTFLALPEWRTLPWIDTKDELDITHTFVDIYVDLPGIKHDAQNLWHYAERHELLKFFSRCLDIISRLKTWREQWNLSPEGQISAVQSHLEHHGHSNPFPMSFEFSSFGAGETFLLYNAALLQVIDIINVTHGNAMTISDGNTLLQSPIPEELAPLANIAATEICQSLEYQLRSDFGSVGQLLVLFPVRMAWKAFGRGSSPEGRWLEGLLSMFATSGGWQCATHAITFGE